MRHALATGVGAVLLALAIGATPVAATTNTDPDQNPPPTPDGRIVNNSPEVIVVSSPGGPSYQPLHS